MSRRKGERPIKKVERPYGPGHPVARWIAGGSGWFDAWVGQMLTPYVVLTKKTGIIEARLFELSYGAAPTLSEVSALAKVWFVPPEGLLASIAEASGNDPLIAVAAS